jgi:hypothetical protein
LLQMGGPARSFSRFNTNTQVSNGVGRRLEATNTAMRLPFVLELSRLPNPRPGHYSISGP